MKVRPEDWRPRGVEDLEDAAWEALRTPTAAIIAGPGAGKTEFLAQRASYLLETDLCRSPRQILAISFKRDAARNLHQRLSERIPEHSHRVTSMTFDAFSKSIVDRFRTLLPPAWALSGDYRIEFVSAADVRSFLRATASTAPANYRQEILGLPYAGFVSELLGATPLDPTPSEPTSGAQYAVAEWWNQRYRDTGTPLVDFTMLNRLAELIIRSSKQLRLALRATFPFVFVDEFQDTTYAQYSFLESVFPPHSTSVTVVGDVKQRIMGWAGAHTDAFSQFDHDYGGARFELEHNFRSRQELVDLQHRFARRLHPDAQPQVSRVINKEDGPPPAQVWSFSTSALEAGSVAAWIAADIDQSKRRPAQYALVARQKVAELEPLFAQAFTKQGLMLRNDDASVGKLKLGDLLKDELVELLVGIIQVAASRGGQAEVWQKVTLTLSRIRPPELGRQIGSRADDELSEFLQRLRVWLSATPVESIRSTVEASSSAAAALTQQLTEFLRLDLAAGKRIFADRAGDIEDRLEAFTIRLTETIAKSETWQEVPKNFVDADAISLMTIHRSKGLEYHTVFFIGLDGDQWWAHTRDTVESTMAFFVGISRAAETLILTRCDERGSPSKIADLYAELEAAGVQTVRLG